MLPIRINDIKYDIPTDLSEIPLGRFVDFYTQYGNDLDKRLKEILDKEYTDEFEKELDLSSHEDSEALSWFSFWTGEDLLHIKAADAASLILLYRSIKTLLNNSEESSYELPMDIEWNEEIWQIQDYKVTPKSNFCFNELITSKEVMRQLRALGKGKWPALIYLSCVFLRKKDEKFSDDLILEGGKRMELMKTLPLHHALKVSFFLSVSINTWKNTLVSSKEAEEIAMLQ